MVIRVDLTAQPAAVALEDAGDFRRFSLRVSGSHDRAHLAAALTTSGIGKLLGGDDVAVDPDALRELAMGRVGDDWESGLAGMLRFAEAHDWVDDDGGVQAHVEWE